MVELAMDVGLRPGELYGLHGHRVDWMRGHLGVVDVMTRQGLREYPKSMKSHRTVPIPAATLEGMSRLIRGRPRDSMVVFTTPGGGPVSDGYLRAEIWYPAVEAARLCGGRSAGEAEEGDLVIPGQCGKFCDNLVHRSWSRRPGQRSGIGAISNPCSTGMS